MEEVLEENNKTNTPKEGMEYIYNLGMAWPIYSEDDKRPLDTDEPDIMINSKEELDSLDGKPYSIKVKEGIVVTDVSHTERGYEFTIKEMGIRCRTNYPWAFWENTPDNLKNIEEYKKEKRELEKQKLYTYSLLDKINKIKE